MKKNSSKLKLALEVLVNALIIAILAFLIYVNISHYIYRQIVLAVVNGSSMLPLLRDDDLVIVVPPNNIELGDIVIYRNDKGDYVIHRVIAIAECQQGYRVYITKGDNNPYTDTGPTSMIALKVSKSCSVEKLYVLKGFEGLISREYGMPRIEDLRVIRGLPEDVIVGKALSIYDLTVKISGLTRLRFNP